MKLKIFFICYHHNIQNIQNNNMSSIVSNSTTSSESKRSSPRLQNRPSPPFAVFCGMTVDRSGSMSNIHTTAAGGVFKCINEQIQGAQENGQNGYLFLTTFDDHITEIYKNTNFKEIVKSINSINE